MSHIITAKSIWIVGSGLIKRAQPRGANMKIKGNVEWMGKGGMRWTDVLPTVRGKLASQPAPDILLLHVGDNDLGQTPRLTLINKMKKDIKEIMETCPRTKIVYSGIVARQQWRGAKNKKQINATRNWLNNQMKKIIEKKNGAVILHKNIVSHNTSLFSQDGVHLTEKGNDLFISQLESGLKLLE